MNSHGRSPSGIWIAGAVIGVILTQVLYGILVFYFLGPQMAIRGQFGDINALFTGLAFAGVIYTILLQRRELELQREELRLNRGELSRSAQAQTEQVEMLKQSADLSAMTALVSAYGTALEPFRTANQTMRATIADLNSNLRSATVSVDERKERRNRIGALENEISSLEKEWSDTLNRYRKLISNLENMVDQETIDESKKAET